eukprot:UN00951
MSDVKPQQITEIPDHDEPIPPINKHTPPLPPKPHTGAPGLLGYGFPFATVICVILCGLVWGFKPVQLLNKQNNNRKTIFFLFADFNNNNNKTNKKKPSIHQPA